MYHIKNLTQIKEMRDPIMKKMKYTKIINGTEEKVQLDEGMAVTDMFPVVQNGTIFCVVSIKGIQEPNEKKKAH